MTLSPAWLDELRARTVLSAVIAPTVKLIRAGREWKACCPFHNEKTPSFTVNDDKGFYHCFGCGAHGDAIRFLTDNRGMQFMDAVKELAAKAGMEVPAPDPKAKERADRAASLATHSSSGMIRSAPRRSSASITHSGVSSIGRPSMCDSKRTPSSLTARSPPSENT